jgi:hypothetical protein
MVSVRGIKDHYKLYNELEQQQNTVKDNPHTGFERRIFCYPGRYPRLKGTCFLRLIIIQIVTLMKIKSYHIWTWCCFHLLIKIRC